MHGSKIKKKYAWHPKKLIERITVSNTPVQEIEHKLWRDRRKWRGWEKMGWCVEGTWEKYRISLPPYIQECSNADPYPECSNANTTNHHRSRGQSQAKAIFLAEIWFCRTPDPHPHRCLILHGHGKEGRSRGCHYVEISWTPRSSRINSTSTPWIHLKLHPPLGRHHAWPRRGRRSRVPSLPGSATL